MSAGLVMTGAPRSTNASIIERERRPAAWTESRRWPDPKFFHAESETYIRRMRLPSTASVAITAAILLAATACGDGATGVDVRALAVTPGAGLAVGVGGTMRFQAVAVGADGTRLGDVGVTWSTDDPAIATIDDAGRARGVAGGVTVVTARAGEFTATAALEVYIAPRVVTYVPGASYFGRRGYIEYIPGELPIVLSAAHGGALMPDEIADRSFGTSGADRNTIELTLAVRDAIIDLTGLAPGVIISHLARIKLDANRDIEEAAQGDPFAEQAWTEFHDWIRRARSVFSGEGMYFDMHGHGHPAQRLELGYLLSSEQLNGSDASLDGLPVIRMSSLREIGRDSPIPFSQVLRGPTSLGGLLADQGVPAVPSPDTPGPGSDPYFTGGYNTRAHGSQEDSELVSGIQIEHHFAGLRDTDANRLDYAARLAVAIQTFMIEHIGYSAP
jgi:hypothetical protein